jgi:hypothetical protein
MMEFGICCFVKSGRKAHKEKNALLLVIAWSLFTFEITFLAVNKLAAPPWRGHSVLKNLIGIQTFHTRSSVFFATHFSATRDS